MCKKPLEDFRAPSFIPGMKQQLAALCLAPLFALFACAGAVGAPEPQPAVIVGGFIDPPADSPASHDLSVSDGDTEYRVMFGLDSGQAIADRINAITGATIRASLTPEGRLQLETVETGPAAHIEVVKGAAVRRLGFIADTSVDGR